MQSFRQRKQQCRHWLVRARGRSTDLVDEITANNISVKAIQVDVTDETSEKFYQDCDELFGDIDILINNAEFESSVYNRDIIRRLGEYDECASPEAHSVFSGRH